MKGLILSGGKGTRLYPLTYTLAKQLVPLANKPVLVRVIETIRDAGVTDIGIVVGDPTAAEIMQKLGDGSAYGVKLTFIKQPSPDGLAHAVKISEPFLGDDRFVMFLGDNCLQGGIGSLIRGFGESGYNSQIVLKEMPDPRSYGVADVREDGSIRRLVEKPKDPPSNLALVGVYMFDQNIFKAVNAIQPSQRGEYEITDAIQWLIDNGYSVYPHVHKGWYFDTGNAIDMLDANAAVLEELTPGIAPDATIENSHVDPRVIVQAGARIVNSIVRGPAIIGENTLIEDSYIGPFTSIYHSVVVSNCEIERSIILEETTVTNLPARLQDSLIGRKVTLTRNNSKPKAYKMNLGDNSVVRVE